MDIFAVFALCGGIAFFLFGMSTMSSNLEKLAGGHLESVLRKMTSNPFKSLLLGAGITVAIQSSTAVTVMLVGLVNSGIMELGQSIGVIMGSNIGTTLTAWILSLSGIEGDSLLMQMLKPENFSPVIALLGIILRSASKKDKMKSVGNIMLGFSILMYGTIIMKEAVSPLADMPEFTNLLLLFKNPILGVIAGAVLTIIVQSSAASVGILQALSATGNVTFGMAIPIIMGQNIGTCLTAVLSGVGANKSAKRVGFIHVSFNVIGTVICLVLFYTANFFCHFSFVDDPIDMWSIAVVHSIFNIATTVFLLPFTKQLEKLACFVIRDDKKTSGENYVLLDDRLLQSPGFAVVKCRENVVEMADLSRMAAVSAINLVQNYDEQTEKSIADSEKELDELEDTLGTFLIKLSACSISGQESNEVSQMLHSITDLERIGDHALSISKGAAQVAQRQLSFSDAARQELTTLSAAVTEILTMTTEAFAKEDRELASRVEPLEEVIDNLTGVVRDRHVERLKSGACSVELGLILGDLLADYERISDHCSNVAACMIQTAQASYDTHRYLQEIKTGKDPKFVSAYEEYQQKYRLA